MATWITHLRIAEGILKQSHFKLNIEEFILGNIAPDCGIPDETKSTFNPPKEITHFKNKHIDYKYDNIDLKQFFTSYVLPNLHTSTFSFALGYYLHLVVDILWHQVQMNKRKDEIYNQHFKSNQSLYRDELMNIDLKYINDLNQSIYNRFKEISYVNDYFDFLPHGILTIHLNTITNHYNQSFIPLKHYHFTTPTELDQFVTHSVEWIKNHLEQQFKNNN